MIAKILKTLAFMVILFGSVQSFAQQFGTCTYVQPGNGAPSRWNCPTGTPTPTAQLTATPNGPTQFISNGNTYNCPAIAGWGGGLIGAILGNALGKEITTQGQTLGGLGAVAGAFAGNQIACEYVRPQTVTNQGVSANSVQEPSLCSVAGRPDLQNLQGLTKAQCAAISGTKDVQVQKTYGTSPVKKDGHTCAVFNKNGDILADFLDATKNPKGVVVQTGAECLKERDLFSQK